MPMNDSTLNACYDSGRLSWPQMNWHLWGRYTVFEPGQRLAFPWQWEHMRYSLAKEVTVTFEPLALAGTRMTITHGPYSDSEEDRQARQEHLDGWLHFVARLQQAL